MWMGESPNLLRKSSLSCRENGRKPLLACLLHDERHDRRRGATGTNRRMTMNKTSLVSALAALFLSSVAVGSAVVPATGAGAAPAVVSQNA
jgi:hypothetical protein